MHIILSDHSSSKSMISGLIFLLKEYMYIYIYILFLLGITKFFLSKYCLLNRTMPDKHRLRIVCTNMYMAYFSMGVLGTSYPLFTVILI